MPSGWIGVDLDGTLALYDGWKGATHIGDPIPPMLQRVKNWLAEGREVRIFTARVATGDGNRAEAEREQVERAIELWCIEHLDRCLPITNVKDFAMIELWDDRAVQVIPNTGMRADGKGYTPHVN